MSIIIIIIMNYKPVYMAVCVFILYLLAEHSLSGYFWCFHKYHIHRPLYRMYILHQTVDWTLHKLGTVVPVHHMSVLWNM